MNVTMFVDKSQRREAVKIILIPIVSIVVIASAEWRALSRRC